MTRYTLAALGGSIFATVMCAVYGEWIAATLWGLIAAAIFVLAYLDRRTRITLERLSGVLSPRGTGRIMSPAWWQRYDDDQLAQHLAVLRARPDPMAQQLAAEMDEELILRRLEAS